MRRVWLLQRPVWGRLLLTTPGFKGSWANLFKIISFSLCTLLEFSSRLGRKSRSFKKFKREISLWTRRSLCWKRKWRRQPRRKQGFLGRLQFCRVNSLTSPKKTTSGWRGRINWRSAWIPFELSTSNWSKGLIRITLCSGEMIFSARTRKGWWVLSRESRILRSPLASLLKILSFSIAISQCALRNSLKLRVVLKF